MIARYLLHLEAHRGHRPRLSLRRAPRPGDRVVDGGIPGTLAACEPCSGEGFLVEPGRPLTVLERVRYQLAAGVRIPPRLLGLPPLAPQPATPPAGPYSGFVTPPSGPTEVRVADQGVRADAPPAGKNDQALTTPALALRPDDAAERAARDYFGADYARFAAHGDHEGTGHLVAFRAGWHRAAAASEAEVRAIRRTARTGGPRLAVAPGPDDALPPTPAKLTDALRAHPLHPVIAEALRWGNPAGDRGGAPTDHLFAVAYGGASTWHADPEQVADLVLHAIADAPAGPVTREASARIREALTALALAAGERTDQS